MKLPAAREAQPQSACALYHKLGAAEQWTKEVRAGGEFAAMTPEQHAEDKGVQIVERNPAHYALLIAGRGRRMAMNKRMLERRISELEEQNEDLQSRLDSVLDIVRPEADDDDSEDDSDNDD